MKSKNFYRSISILLCLLTVTGIMSVSLTAGAAVLPDGYENEYESITYQDLGILEDQYDLIEPVNNLFPIISPSSKHDTHLLYKGSYQQVENYLKNHNMTDGMSIVPPTKIKAEKFLGYSSYGFDQTVATVNGRNVKAYMVAANAIMAGCAPEHTPFCVAFTEALSNSGYLASLSSSKLTPMMYVNGPAAHQIGIDNTQGMTTEETNIAIGRFMELALINFTDIERSNAFGNVQPLVFSENDETCLNIGWEPHHVEKGYALNDNIITATSFSMWGNNVTPATDLPEEIMKVIAWDITEKNLGGLGSASVADNANAKRLIFITESVATALATKYKTKEALENALIANARRPLWMRAYAYYYANTGGALTKSFRTVYNELKASPSEDAKLTASPAWMNGITYANIETVATMKKGNTDIIVTGDSSRNKTQVMPGGVSVSKQVKLSNRWDSLVTSVNYFPIADFYLNGQSQTITPPSSLPAVLTNGTYRILDPASGANYLTRAGRVYFDSSANTLYYYAYGASSSSSVVLDPEQNKDFLAYLDNLGYNSSFTVSNRKMTDATIRFSSNNSKLNNNTVALTAASFSGLGLTLHANNTSNSNAAGGLAKDGATVNMSDSVTSYTVNLDGSLTAGDTTDAGFVTLSGTTVTVDPSVEAGATAVIGASNGNGTYRTMTFVNGGDGSYKITYNTAGTLSLSGSSLYLKGTFNNWSANDVFAKTANSDVVALTKELSAGTYTFKLHNTGTDKWYGKDDAVITDTVNRLTLTAAGGDCTFTATGGTYEFKFELSTNRLSVYLAENTAMDEQPTAPPVTTYLLGDTNLDGKVNINDVTAIQRHISAIESFTQEQLLAADTNCDSRVNISDATELQMYLANYNIPYPIGELVSVNSAPTQPTATEPAATTAPTTVAPTTAAPTTAPGTYTVVLTNALNWSGTIYCYYWADGYNPVQWCGTPMNYIGTNDYGQKQYSLTITSRSAKVIFTNGSVQTVDLPISGNTNFYTKNETENGKYKCGTW